MIRIEGIPILAARLGRTKQRPRARVPRTERKRLRFAISSFERRCD
jgi:hypothetical protein